MVLPSFRSTHMLSASKRTRVALTEVLMPCPLNQFPVRFDDPDQFAKVPSIIAIIVSQAHFWIKPEFRFHSILFNMDMDGFPRCSLVRVKEKSETTLTEDNWHGTILLP